MWKVRQVVKKTWRGNECGGQTEGFHFLMTLFRTHLISAEADALIIRWVHMKSSCVCVLKEKAVKAEAN